MVCQSNVLFVLIQTVYATVTLAGKRELETDHEPVARQRASDDFVPVLLECFKGAEPHGAIAQAVIDRKSTRLNSSHVRISYAVFCLKKKKKRIIHNPVTARDYLLKS